MDDNENQEYYYHQPQESLQGSNSVVAGAPSLFSRKVNTNNVNNYSTSGASNAEVPFTDLVKSGTAPRPSAFASQTPPQRQPLFPGASYPHHPHPRQGSSGYEGGADLRGAVPAAAFPPSGRPQRPSLPPAPSQTRSSVGVDVDVDADVDGGSVSAASSASLDYVEIEQKQSELKQAVEYHIASLTRAVEVKEEENRLLRGQLRKIEEDYQFNYSLIGERDAALDEASQQLQRLHRELSRVTAEGSAMGKRAEAAEGECQALQRRLREAEVERERALEQVRREYAIKERHLTEAYKEKEAALDEERRHLHEQHMEQLRDLQSTRDDAAARSNTLAEQLEERYQQVTHRLESDLAAARKHAAAETKERESVEAQLAALRAEHERDAERHHKAVSELLSAKQMLESRYTETSEQMEKNIAGVEDLIRTEGRRAAQLELEKTTLQAQLVDTQERLQHAYARRDEETDRYRRESEELRRTYEESQRVLTELEKTSGERVARLQAALQARTDEANRLRLEKERLEQSEAHAREQLQERQAECTRLHQTNAQLAAEVQRWREEEARTSTEAHRAAGEAEQTKLTLERALQAARDEAERHRRKLMDTQERAQTDTARLTRELHASEAARRALEDQYHLTQDQGSQLALIRGLQSDKETLERRVAELEATNAAIQQEVANFTLELQSDPLVKDARATHLRVQALQQELLEARADLQSAKDALRDKEDQMARYQVELLRSGGGALLAGGKQEQELKEECARIQRAYDDVRRKLKRERSRRHHRHRGHSPSAASSASDDGDGDDSGDEGGTKHRQRLKLKKRRDHSAGSEGRAAGRQPEQERQESYLLRESEVWRGKCLQLETHLRQLLRERDQLQQELRAAREDAESLTKEKRSLLDLNSLLKAQLREAYRTALGKAGTPAPAPAPPPLSPPPLAASVEQTPAAYDTRRMETLEEEIRSIKEKIASAREPHTERGTAARRGGAASTSSAAGRERDRVARKGGTAVRHYGYQ